MILPLRQRHRRLMMALGIFLPIAFVYGIAARKPVPVMASLPPALADSTSKFPVQEWERADLFKKLPVRVSLLSETSVNPRFAVKLSATKDFVKPDLIVYWISGNPNFTAGVPSDAVLLGVFSSSTALALPPNALPGSGGLLLYSLADHEIVEVSQPFTFRKN